MDTVVFTVSELTHYIKALVENDGELSSAIVIGEISNFTYHSSGHMYFTLKDKNSKLKCVMFRSRNRYLKFTPRNGLKVLLQGRLSVYERNGEYQLYAENMQPEGIGAMHLAFTELKDKLACEGLFDDKKKKSLPYLPQKIAVITSPTGAAVRDIITTINQRFQGVDIVLIPSLVQGEQAAKNLVDAIEMANQLAEIDVIIIGRGGGSIEELWAFNEEIVARAIANSIIPVVSAVGHETDFTIADFVADVRVPTPTAAGQHVVPALAELKDGLLYLSTRLDTVWNNSFTSYHEKLDALMQRLVAIHPERVLEQKWQEIDSNLMSLNFCFERHLERAISSFNGKVDKLETLNPLKVLQRGFTVVKHKGSQELITSIHNTNIGDFVEIMFQDGVSEAKIINLQEGWRDELKQADETRN